MGFTNEEVPISVMAQVCNITKPLLSVKKMCNAGNTVVFDSEGSYIQCKRTGACTEIKDQGGKYSLPIWVHTSFHGQGGQR